jgi:hypothetical protein
MMMFVFGGAHSSSAQAARGLRAPWALVQRFARPVATLIVYRPGTGGAQRRLASKASAAPVALERSKTSLERSKSRELI